MTKETVFVVDGEEGVRSAVTRLLDSLGIETRCFASPSEFLALPAPDCPQCLVLEIRLVGLSGLDLQQELLKSGRHVPMVFITAHGDVRTSVRAMKAGAVDFLQKPFNEQELLDAITLALRLDSQARTRQAEKAVVESRLRKLSPREMDVFRLVVTGFANKLIAARLGITEKTVKAHRGQVMRKMQVQSLADLVRLAERFDCADRRQV